MLLITYLEIMTNIIMFLNTLVNLNLGKYTLWEKRTFNFSEYDNMIGYLDISNAEISIVLDGNPFDIVDVTMDETTGRFNACLHNVFLPQFNFTFDYVADLVINDFPIYGEGSYRSQLVNTNTTFYWILPPTADEILDFDISVVFQHQPVSLTGLYKNEELDPIVGNLLTQAKRFFAMWNNYEQDCIRKCILNPISIFLTNFLIYDINKGLTFQQNECACLLGLQKALIADLSVNANEGSNLVQEVINLFTEA